MSTRRQGGWIKNPWRCGVGSVRLRRFTDWKDGDGLKRVWVSFYSAPELCIEVYVDSVLPLELPEQEPYTGKRCFRTVLDELWRHWKEAWWSDVHPYEPPVPEHRRRELLAAAEMEMDDDPGDALWRLIERDGCTWMLAW